MLDERDEPEAPVCRYARNCESEEDDDAEVRPAQSALDVGERQRADDAHEGCEDADEDEPGRRHVQRCLAE